MRTIFPTHKFIVVNITYGLAYSGGSIKNDVVGAHNNYHIKNTKIYLQFTTVLYEFSSLENDS